MSVPDESRERYQDLVADSCNQKRGLFAFIGTGMQFLRVRIGQNHATINIFLIILL